MSIAEKIALAMVGMTGLCKLFDVISARSARLAQLQGNRESSLVAEKGQLLSRLTEVEKQNVTLFEKVFALETLADSKEMRIRALELDNRVCQENQNQLLREMEVLRKQLPTP